MIDELDECPSMNNDDNRISIVNREAVEQCCTEMLKKQDCRLNISQVQDIAEPHGYPAKLCSSMKSTPECVQIPVLEAC